jgi:plastocyanin
MFAASPMKYWPVLLLLSTPAVAQPRPPAPGKVTGTVIFEGVPPVRKPLVRDADPYCNKGEALAEDVIVSPKGRLKDVFVRLKNPPPGATTPPAVVLDQKDCTYTPRVVAVAPGAKLAVRNSDGTFHNVNGSISGKQLWNKPMAAKDPDLALPTSPKPGDLIEIVCNVHPWMRAYAVVIDHAYFGITGEDGTFTIPNLPAGTYTLEAWHAKLGTRTLEIKIGSGAKATAPARISYKTD